MMDKPKVIIIGLDGARLDVLVKWAKQGYLPMFNKILNEGVHGTLKSVLPIHSFPAWTSLSTGVYPPKHGIYDILLRDESGYSRKPPSSTMVKVKRFWEILDEFGYKCLIVNVPATYPPKPLKHGVIVSSVLTPSTDHVFAYPKEIWEMLRKQGYKILPKARPGTEEYIKEVHEILDKQYAFIKWYVENNDWDLVFWVVMSTEMLHHHYATFIDPKHSLYKPEYEEIVRKLYEKVDAYITDLLKIVNKDYILFIVSDHGFAPYYGAIYLNSFLRKKGFLATKNGWMMIKQKLLVIAKKIGKNIYAYLPKRLKEKAIAMVGFGAYEFTLELIEWSKTKAYVAFLDGHINVNLKNRESNGIVDKKEYEFIIREILKSVQNDQVLSKILTLKPKYEIYREGKYLDLVPDIFVLFGEANEKPFKIKTDPFAKNFIDYKLTQFNENVGYHTLFGVFLAYGYCIKRGYNRNASIVDIAPTILAIFGIKPPQYMDGNILDDIFVCDIKPVYDIKDIVRWKLRSTVRRVIR